MAAGKQEMKKSDMRVSLQAPYTSINMERRIQSQKKLEAC